MKMSHDTGDLAAGLPPEQRALHARCFHPSGHVSEFPKTDIERSVIARFERIVKKYPERIAVKTAQHSLCYAELNSMSNCVAGAIITQAGEGMAPVGILCSSGWQLLAAMLGAWKAGKFIVLLDPMFPSPRIATMVEDCEAGLIIADQQNVSLASEAAGKERLLSFESIEPSAAAGNPRRKFTPGALACIVYTSGSTGRAKAVMLTHHNMLHQSWLFTHAYHQSPQDRVALLTSGTSNTVHTALFTLLNGAMLLPFDAGRDGVTRMADWLALEKISISMFSSPLFRSVCQTLTGKENFSELRLIRLRSEAVYKSDFDLYKRHFPRHCLLASGLASSETGLTRNCFFDHDSKITGDEVPLGYAVADKKVWLVDSDGRRAGDNEIGEIVVQSRYLSSGYWRRPELTAAKFKPVPDGGAERICFTGDLGLLLPDGCLVHKGRADFRVKVRGYGVEPAEIEKTLLEHPGVGEAVVMAVKNKSAESRLVAYFTSSNQPRCSASDLRSFLQGKLPSYMTPSSFIALDAMPLTPNGKLDRNALPAPDDSRPELSTAFKAPKSSTEKRLADIWADVLGLDRVGIDDDFFDLGGHSLSATRVISRVIRSFQLNLPVDVLFRSATVAEMAAVIGQKHRRKASPEEIARILSEIEALSETEAEQILKREISDRH